MQPGRKDEKFSFWMTVPSLDEQEPSEEDQHRTPLSRIRDILNPKTLELKAFKLESPQVVPVVAKRPKQRYLCLSQ